MHQIMFVCWGCVGNTYIFRHNMSTVVSRSSPDSGSPNVLNRKCFRIRINHTGHAHSEGTVGLSLMIHYSNSSKYSRMCSKSCAAEALWILIGVCPQRAWLNQQGATSSRQLSSKPVWASFHKYYVHLWVSHACPAACHNLSPWLVNLLGLRS